MTTSSRSAGDHVGVRGDCRARRASTRGRRGRDARTRRAASGAGRAGHDPRKRRQHLVERAGCEHAAAIEDEEAGGPLGLVEVRRRHDDRGAGRGRLGHQAPQVDAADGIDARARLVEHEQRRLVQHRHAEAELAPHAAGQLGGEPVVRRR